MVTNFVPPWDWDWHWPYVFMFLGGCYFFGLVCGLLHLPGIIPVVIAAIVAALAGQFGWFEK